MTAMLAMDIGGTKIQACSVDADMAVRALGRTPTALLRRGTTAFAADLASLIRSIRPPACARIGVSLNGVLDRGTAVYSSLMGGRVDFPLGVFLSETLACPVVVDDDIHAMTLAEARLGVGRSVASFAMVNIGTGIGVGFFDRGVLRGRFAAGLISEQPIWVEEFGEYRSLDRTVCGRGIRDVYRQLSGEDADAITVFRRGKEKDASARATIAIFSRYLGATLQLVSRFYHPALIVLNGSIKFAADQYLATAMTAYRTGLDQAFQADIVVSRLQHAAELGTLLSESASEARP